LSRKKEEEEYIPKAFQKSKKQEDKQTPKKKGKGKKKKATKKKKLKKIILSVILLAVVGIGISLGISATTWKKLAKEMLLNQNSVVMDTFIPMEELI